MLSYVLKICHHLADLVFNPCFEGAVPKGSARDRHSSFDGTETIAQSGLAAGGRRDVLVKWHVVLTMAHRRKFQKIFRRPAIPLRNFWDGSRCEGDPVSSPPAVDRFGGVYRRDGAGMVAAAPARPPRGRPRYARAKTLLTDFAYHAPPRGVVMPRALRASAIACSDRAPLRCISRITGSTLAA